MKTLILSLVAVCAFADPLKDLAVSQRNYVIARVQMDAAAKAAEAAQQAAEQSCKTAGKTLDPKAVECVKPEPEPKK